MLKCNKFSIFYHNIDNSDKRKMDEIMRCEFCNHKFDPCEHFVVGREDDGEEVFMCETCFFDLSLSKLNCKEFQMSCDGTNYYNLLDGEEEQNK